MDQLLGHKAHIWCCETLRDGPTGLNAGGPTSDDVICPTHQERHQVGQIFGTVKRVWGRLNSERSSQSDTSTNCGGCRCAKRRSCQTHDGIDRAGRIPLGNFDICSGSLGCLFAASARHSVEPWQKARVPLISSEDPFTPRATFDGHKILDASALDPQTHIRRSLQASNHGAAANATHHFLKLAANGRTPTRGMHVVETRVSLFGCGDGQPTTPIPAIAGLNTRLTTTQSRRLLKDGRAQGVHRASRPILFMELLQNQERLRRVCARWTE